MIFKRLTAIILFVLVFFVQNTTQNAAYCADNYRVKEAIIDSSDRMVLISGYDNVKGANASIYIQNNSSNALNILNKITTAVLTAPNRYMIDIPHATLIGASKVYKVQNSTVIDNIQISQITSTPNIVRIIFTLHANVSANRFKTYFDGNNIIVKYKDSIIDNSIQYKFYTPSGDMEKTANLQNVSSILSYNNSNNTYDLTPRLQTKYYLSKISQNSDGLILRGLGSISLQRAYYSPDGTKATVIMDNAKASSKVLDKTYNIPTSQKDEKAELSISKLSTKKLKLTLSGKNLKDYRFVVSPDGQCLFVSHRNYITQTTMSSNITTIQSYKMSKTQNGYSLFEINFTKPVTYNVFEQNNNFYLDINNLSDYNQNLLKDALKASDIKVETVKIATDKTRFIIPSENLNFAYANIESNLKSVKLCFKDKPKGEINKTEILVSDIKNPSKDVPTPIIIAQNTPEKILKPTEKTQITEKFEKDKNNKEDDKTITYMPKSEDKTTEIKNPERKDIELKGKISDRFKNKKDNLTIKSTKRVLLDPGHGGADSGAVSGGIYEKTLNLSVAKLVGEKLKEKGVQVDYTRLKDVTMTLEDRVNFANEISPDIFISIHTNSTVQEDSYGLETHYFKDDSYDLANVIHTNFACEANLVKWETKDRGVIKSRFYVINHTEVPSVLIEMGFISNKTERSKLLLKERQEQIADSIAQGIAEYLGIK